MAGPQNRPTSGEAETTVFENLQIDPADLAGDIPADGEDDYDPDATGDDTADVEAGRIDEQDSLFESNRQPAQQRQPKSAQRPIPARAEVKPDAKGNLVDAAGKIVAKAGTEARLYQKGQHAQRALNAEQGRASDLQGRLGQAVQIGRDLHAEVQQFKAREAQLKEFGLTPEDQLEALRLFSGLRRDPATTIQSLLTRAAAKGIQLNNLGTPGGIDVKSITELLKTEIATQLNPLKERNAQEETQRKEREQEDQRKQRVTDEVNSFFAQNPDARDHLSVFENVLSDPRYSTMSLGEVWARIQLNLERRQRTQPVNSRTPSRGSMLNGRRMPAAGNTEISSVNESYDSILKDILDQQGIR